MLYICLTNIQLQWLCYTSSKRKLTDLRLISNHIPLWSALDVGLVMDVVPSDTVVSASRS